MNSMPFLAWTGMQGLHILCLILACQLFAVFATALPRRIETYPTRVDFYSTWQCSGKHCPLWAKLWAAFISLSVKYCLATEVLLWKVYADIISSVLFKTGILRICSFILPYFPYVSGHVRLERSDKMVGIREVNKLQFMSGAIDVTWPVNYQYECTCNILWQKVGYTASNSKCICQLLQKLWKSLYWCFEFLRRTLLIHLSFKEMTKAWIGSLEVRFDLLSHELYYLSQVQSKKPGTVWIKTLTNISTTCPLIILFART